MPSTGCYAQSAFPSAWSRCFIGTAMKKNTRLLAIGFGVFVVLVVIAAWMEHLRAKGALAAYKKELVAKGEKLTIAENTPPPLKGVTNGAAAVLDAARDLRELEDCFQPGRMRMLAPGRAMVSWQQSVLGNDRSDKPMDDLWPGVAVALAAQREAIEELRAAVESSVVDFAFDYSKGLLALRLEHLAKIQKGSLVLSHAAVLDMHDGRRAEAWTNLHAATLLVTRWRGEPVMISDLVHHSVVGITFGTTWEALQFPGWDDRQLETLQALWQPVRFDNPAPAFEMERAMNIALFAEAREHPGKLAEVAAGEFDWDQVRDNIFTDPKKALEVAGDMGRLLVWPIWTSYGDEQWLLGHFQSRVEAARTMHTTYALTNAWPVLDAGDRAMGTPPKRFLLSHVMEDSYSRVFLLKFARAEVSRQMMVTALALHRHKLRHGKFPENLAALMPEFLPEVPRDFIDGQPLRYRPLPDGQFLLYSIGQDAVDNGGDPSPDPKNPTWRSWNLCRDWVWPLPASAAEVAKDAAESAAKRARK